MEFIAEIVAGNENPTGTNKASGNSGAMSSKSNKKQNSGVGNGKRGRGRAKKDVKAPTLATLSIADDESGAEGKSPHKRPRVAENVPFVARRP